MALDTDTNREVLERVRRIETRVTKIGRHFDIDVGGGRPVWNDGTIVVPSPNCSAAEIIKTIPESYRGDEVDVYVGADYLMTIRVDV